MKDLIIKALNEAAETTSKLTPATENKMLNATTSSVRLDKVEDFIRKNNIPSNAIMAPAIGDCGIIFSYVANVKLSEEEITKYKRKIFSPIAFKAVSKILKKNNYIRTTKKEDSCPLVRDSHLFDLYCKNYFDMLTEYYSSFFTYITPLYYQNISDKEKKALDIQFVDKNYLTFGNNISFNKDISNTFCVKSNAQFSYLTKEQLNFLKRWLDDTNFVQEIWDKWCELYNSDDDVDSYLHDQMENFNKWLKNYKQKHEK